MKNKGLRFIVMLILTAGWIFLMRALTRPLDPGLIIDFEFIGSSNAATQFLSSLQASGQLELLTRSIFLDFIFPLLYGATFYYASAWICSKLPLTHIFNRFNVLAAMTIIAVCCDFLENLSMLKLIYYPPSDLFAMAAYFFATFKFTLLGLVLTHFIMSGLIVILDSKKVEEVKS